VGAETRAGYDQLIGNCYSVMQLRLP